jgi:hypothetical protein
MEAELVCGAWEGVEPAVWLASGDFRNLDPISNIFQFFKYIGNSNKPSVCGAVKNEGLDVGP